MREGTTWRQQSTYQDQPRRARHRKVRAGRQRQFLTPCSCAALFCTLRGTVQKKGSPGSRLPWPAKAVWYIVHRCFSHLSWDTKGRWKSNTKRECMGWCAQCTQCGIYFVVKDTRLRARCQKRSTRDPRAEVGECSTTPYALRECLLLYTVF